MKRRETTLSRPARSGTWNPRYGVRPSGRPQPRPIERPLPFFPRGARRDARLERAYRLQREETERPDADALHRTSVAHRLDDAARGVRRANLDLDDQRQVRVADESVGEGRHADAAIAQGIPVCSRRTSRPRRLGPVPRPCGPRPGPSGGAPIEVGIVMQHGHAVTQRSGHRTRGRPRLLPARDRARRACFPDRARGHPGARTPGADNRDRRGRAGEPRGRGDAAIITNAGRARRDAGGGRWAVGGSGRWAVGRSAWAR